MLGSSDGDLAVDTCTHWSPPVMCECFNCFSVSTVPLHRVTACIFHKPWCFKPPSYVPFVQLPLKFQWSHSNFHLIVKLSVCVGIVTSICWFVSVPWPICHWQRGWRAPAPAPLDTACLFARNAASTAFFPSPVCKGMHNLMLLFASRLLLYKMHTNEWKEWRQPEKSSARRKPVMMLAWR